MFYIRKPAKTEPISIIRTATSVELHNYKNRFIIQPPVTETEPDTAPGCDNNCGCDNKSDELLFININCDLDLNEL